MKIEDLSKDTCWIKRPKSLPLPQTSLACLESLSVPLVQEIVLLADFQCEECQKRISDIMSRMEEMDSIEVNVLGKTVTLTYRYSELIDVATQQDASVYQSRKAAVIARMFRFACS